MRKRRIEKKYVNNIFVLGEGKKFFVSHLEEFFCFKLFWVYFGDIEVFCFGY